MSRSAGCALMMAVSAWVAAVGCGDDAPSTDAGPDVMVCSTDAECDDGVFCNGPEMCMPASRAADMRGCVPAPDPCMPGQTCMEEQARCVTDCEVSPDADGDGHRSTDCGGDDCDDSDPASFPGNAEVCDPALRDEDCDPSTYGELDQDGDGFVSGACCNRQPDGSLECGPDCNDTTIAQQPDQLEICDDVDNDCDGDIDEEMNTVPWYPDDDGDGFGRGDDPMESCSPIEGRSLADTDCDDMQPAASPAGTESCDGLDNDCDGQLDEGMRRVPWYRDADSDGFGVTADAVQSCAAVMGRTLVAGDCDDGAVKVNPVATERCNGADDDCDDTVDEACVRFPDAGAADGGASADAGTAVADGGGL